jgi:hypothetical protein
MHVGSRKDQVGFVVAILSSRDLYCREAAQLSSYLPSGDVEVAQSVQLLPLVSINE